MSIPGGVVIGWDGGGVAGPGTGGSSSAGSGASRRQRGPSSPIRISSSSSHAAVADGGRSSGFFAVSRSIHAEIAGSTSATSAAGGNGSVTCRSMIAIGSSASTNGGLPVNSS